MERPFNAWLDDGREFLHLENKEIGRLEAPPLHDRGQCEPGEGILWVLNSDGQTKTFYYVVPREVTPL